MDESITERRNLTPYRAEEVGAATQRVYWKLGGLGPARIGTEEWLTATRLSARQRAYGRAVQQGNFKSQSPMKERTPERHTPMRLSPQPQLMFDFPNERSKSKLRRYPQRHTAHADN